jgi:hypothetical protein
MAVNCERILIYKETVLAHFEVLSPHSFERNEERHRHMSGLSAGLSQLMFKWVIAISTTPAPYCLLSRRDLHMKWVQYRNTSFIYIYIYITLYLRENLCFVKSILIPYLIHTPKLQLIFRRVRKIAKNSYQICHVCLSAWNNSAPIGRILVKFDCWGFFKNLSRNFKFH